jgi:transcriptional regulator with XRE-family HTH domain
MRDTRHSTRLRVERTTRGETLQRLHERTGISVGRLSMLERGLAPASDAEKQRLAEAYGMTVAELFPEKRQRR